MPSLEIQVLGVGDAFSELHRPTAFLVRCGDFRLAIDCPDAYRAVLRGASGPPLQEVDHFLITHVHGDHMNGLEGVAFFKHFAENKRTRLAITPDVRSVIWDQRLRAAMDTLWDGTRHRQLGFDDYFDELPLAWTEETVIGPLRLQIRRTLHHVPTCALLIRGGGKTFGYSSDTAFDPDLIDFLTPADLIFHETNLGPAHTPYADLAALPATLRERMRLVHYTDALVTLPDPAIVLAREGEVFAL